MGKERIVQTHISQDLYSRFRVKLVEENLTIKDGLIKLIMDYVKEVEVIER